MKLPNFLNPIYLVKKVYLMGREINNYIFYLKTVKKMDNLNILKAYDLRLDWMRNMYTAINMKPEVLMYYEPKELTKFELEYVGNEFTKLENMLIKFELIDLIMFKHKRIQNDKYYAYLLTSKYKFRELSIWWICWIFFVVWGAYKLFYTFDMNAVINYVHSLI